MTEKSVVPREVILLIKKNPPPPHLNPAEKEEAMSSGVPRKTLPAQCSRAVCWSRGMAEQRLPVTPACVCTQIKTLLGKIVFKVELELNQNCRTRHTLSFDRS